MHGDKWWGYQNENGVVTISQQEPKFMAYTWLKKITKIIGPITEDMADEFEGDQKMVRRRIIAAIYDKPLMGVEEEEQRVEP